MNGAWTSVTFCCHENGTFSHKVAGCLKGEDLEHRLLLALRAAMSVLQFGQGGTVTVAFDVQAPVRGQHEKEGAQMTPVKTDSDTTAVQPPQAAEFAGRCRHFTGVMERRCQAGVLYESVRSPEGGILHPLPCFKQDQAAVPCPLASFPTAEEVAERQARILASFARRKAALFANQCPICQSPITSRQQVGSVVVARPCGHELYHGRLPASRGRKAPHQQKEE